MSRALREDIGSGDVTARLIGVGTAAQARVICREPALLCGTPWFDETFRQLDRSVHVHWRAAEGAAVSADTVLCELAGPARAILTGERTALNFLQLLCATATSAQRFVAAVAGTGCQILDTRKTIPGLRSAQKYAVRCGGASNHRHGLYDLVLIKENHIAAAGSIGAAVATARAQVPELRVEVEAEDLSQLQQAIDAGADIVMLDDFGLDQLGVAVALARAHPRPVLLESSGGVTLENVRQIAETGVDYISVGTITKHVTAIDLSMRIQSEND